MSYTTESIVTRREQYGEEPHYEGWGRAWTQEMIESINFDDVSDRALDSLDVVDLDKREVMDEGEVR